MTKIKDIIGMGNVLFAGQRNKSAKYDEGFNSCLNTEVSVDEMAMLRHIEDDFKYDKLTGMNSLEMLLLVTSIARVIKQGKIVRIK